MQSEGTTTMPARNQSQQSLLGSLALRALFFAMIPVAAVAGVALSAIGTALFIPLVPIFMMFSWGTAAPPFEMCCGAMAVFNGMRALRDKAWGKPINLDPDATYIARNGDRALHKLADIGPYEVDNAEAVGFSIITAIASAAVIALIATSAHAHTGEKLQGCLLMVIVAVPIIATLFSPRKRNHNRKLRRALAAGTIAERPPVIQRIFWEKLQNSDLNPNAVMCDARTEIQALLDLASMYDHDKTTYEDSEEIYDVLSDRIGQICENAKGQHGIDAAAEVYVNQPQVHAASRQRHDDAEAHRAYVQSLIRQSR